jgi:hypothetical protein
MNRLALTRATFFPAFLCLACLVFNHAAFRLGAMPVAWALLLLAVIVVVALTAGDVTPAGGITRPPLGASNVAIGLLLLLPLLLSLLLGLNREFPFSGDPSFHLKQAIYTAFWWLSPVATPPIGMLGRELNVDMVRDLAARPWLLLEARATVLIVGLAVVALCYRKSGPLGLAVAALGLTGWGLAEHAIYLRYPGGWYLLAAPFMAPAYLAGNIELGGRLVNVLAAVLWLFALRPWLIGRWPDVPLLAVGSLLLWQQDALFYFDSVYTEPWALVFAMLAVELLVARGAAGVAVACLLIGVASTIKEPYILALPFVWLVGRPWHAPFADTLRNSGAALAAGFPFIFYYTARRSVDIADLVTDRSAEFTVSNLGQYFHGFFLRLAGDYAGTAAIVAVFALAALAVFAVRPSDRRLVALCSIAAAVFIISFFAFDHISLTWAGYFRFFMYPLPFLAIGLLLFGYAATPRVAFGAGLAALVLLAPSAYTAVAWSAGPASGRNFAEHYDSPIVFPLKAILAQARAEAGLAAGAIVLANQPDLAVKAVPGIPITYAAPGELVCICNEAHPDVLALFVRYANLNAPYRDRPPGPDEIFAPRVERDAVWRAQRAERPLCLAQLRQSCKHVIERTEGGEIVAALGVLK